MTYASLTALAITAQAQAVTVNIDFGATGQVAPNPTSGTTSEFGQVWNAVEGVNGANTPAGTTTLSGPLVDSTGAATIVTLDMAWTNATGLDFSRFWDLHPADRDGDYVAIRGDSGGVFNTFTLKGLEENAKYNLTVWANNPGGTDFRVNGGSTVNVIGSTNSSAVNDSTAYTFHGVTANESGAIAMDWGHIDAPATANTWAGFTSMSITAVPEPTSAALLGLGGLSLILHRRK
ncbi:PEP-CTERM sorting domain-containing protein [Verrucomicrobiaceae bacterium N1E253]|uniref:PEP-CTERM sorting domain-containing protein n=1 Tax=Oceaniferula marina TaxID=2748318 RepID=A0A851GHS6_9BACT|nr:PEP-CTERM sorting domain-containing protein [Oceaniferula marina]NWK57338.1 PEP-CTERM sorting domain-containing protein [Oceaniferula marina]